MIENEPWFVLKDVCSVLEIQNSRDVPDRLDGDEKAEVDLIYTSSNGIKQRRKTTIISESGLYSVILRSDKPQAKPFRKWVTSEVLPSIRKTGGYVPVIVGDTPDDVKQRALGIAERTIELQNAQLEELKGQLEELKIQLNGSDAYWTINKFNDFHAMGWSGKECNLAGRKASKASRQKGIEIKRCQTNDDRFSTVGSYCIELLEELFL